MVVTDGTVHVFTYKDGVLAKLAHDLRLSVQTFKVLIEGDQVEATFDPKSIVVDGAVSGETLQEKTLKPSDRDEIRGTINKTILKTGRFSDIVYKARWSANASGGELRGELTMTGSSKPVTVSVTRNGEQLEGRVTLTPSLWGIKPYKALLGALKIQDRVLVSFSLAVPDSPAE